MPTSGDRCESCGHYYVVTHVVQGAIAVYRYLGCRKCGHRPVENKLVEIRSLSSNNFRRFVGCKRYDQRKES